MNREIAKLLLKTKAVTLSTSKPFTWASGIHSPIYTDNRVLLSHPIERRVVIDAFVEEIQNECPDFDVIAGVATSGIPWASWVAEEMDKPLVYVRGKKKDHGRENLIEGRLEKGRKVVVIEDLISTGGSSVSAVEAIRQAGAEVSHCFAIFTYGLKKSVETFKNADCKLITLTDFSTLAELASETGYIT
ncbi:MAG: orotate phosphoribosyltransferase, partial [Candidatus Aenigmarchaeota archaeon]|nr:orotate phosphoribosyltransferase [Candidatus Aenigmarchaeota archaeon]